MVWSIDDFDPPPFPPSEIPPPELHVSNHFARTFISLSASRTGQGEGGKPKHRGTGKDTGDARHRAARRARRTAGDTGAPGGGGRHLNEITGGEEARGVERDERAGKEVGDMELGRGNLGGGERGGIKVINRPNQLTINLKARV